jgi:hypothetical protein
MPSIAEFNNNPGNIRPPKGMTYKGQIGVDDRGFAIFQNATDGRNALIHDIQVKQKNGINTPQDFIDKYTPASAENPEEGRDNYKVGMAGHLGLKSTKDPFPEGSVEKIADFITSFESGKQTGQTEQQANPNNPFAGGVPLADKAREASTTEGTTNTTPEAEDVVNPLAVAGGSALASLPNMYPAQEAEKLQKAKDAVELAKLHLERTLPKNRSYESLSEEFKNRQMAFETAKNEFDLAQKASKALPTPAVSTLSVPQAGSMASATPQIIADPNAQVSQTSQERILQGRIDPTTGNTGRQNMGFNEITSWEANERELQQKALLEAQKAGLIPDTGQQVRSEFGKPSTTRSGLIVKPETAAPLDAQAELEQRMVNDKINQQKIAQQQQLDALQESRTTAKQRLDVAQEAMKKTTPLQATVTKAETAEEMAKRQLSRARGVPSFSRAAVGGIGGLQAARGINELANMPIEELIKRYQAGERSPELLAAIQQAAGATAQTGFGAAATVPVVGPRTAKIKGAGALGTLGMGIYEGYKALTEKEPQ